MLSQLKNNDSGSSNNKSLGKTIMLRANRLKNMIAQTEEVDSSYYLQSVCI